MKHGAASNLNCVSTFFLIREANESQGWFRIGFARVFHFIFLFENHFELFNGLGLGLGLGLGVFFFIFFIKLSDFVFWSLLCLVLLVTVKLDVIIAVAVAFNCSCKIAALRRLLICVPRANALPIGIFRCGWLRSCWSFFLGCWLGLRFGGRFVVWAAFAKHCFVDYLCALSFEAFKHNFRLKRCQSHDFRFEPWIIKVGFDSLTVPEYGALKIWLRWLWTSRFSGRRTAFSRALGHVFRIARVLLVIIFFFFARAPPAPPVVPRLPWFVDLLMFSFFLLLFFLFAVFVVVIRLSAALVMLSVIRLSVVLRVVLLVFEILRLIFIMLLSSILIVLILPLMNVNIVVVHIFRSSLDESILSLRCVSVVVAHSITIVALVCHIRCF